MENIAFNQENQAKGRKALAGLKEALHQNGCLITIFKVSPRDYNVIENFTIVKNYRTRRSCNAYIRRKHRTVLSNTGKENTIAN